MIEVFFSAVYVLFVVNFIASSGTEALSSALKWRAKILFKGVKAILNDDKTQLAAKVYKDALVNPRSPGDEGTDFEKTLPSYIEPSGFANAILSILKLDKKELERLGNIKDDDELLNDVKGIDALNGDEQLSRLLAGSIRRNNGDLDAMRKAIASWFEQSTQRIAGSFKRRTQISSFLIALVIAVMFNVNPLPPSITALTQVEVPPDDDIAIAMAGGVNVVTPTPANGANGTNGANGRDSQANGVQAPPQAGNGSADQLSTSASISAARETAARVFGWLITALSTLLGAPFWFSALSLVSVVRGSGGTQGKETPSPSPKTPASGSSTSGSAATDTSPGEGTGGSTTTGDTPAT